MALTKSDFTKYRVNEVLARRIDDDDLSGWSYQSVCKEERSKLVPVEDENGIKLFTLLSNVSALSLNSRNMELHAPFSQMNDVHGNRSKLTDLFHASELDFLAAVVQEITEPVMRAQIADVLWLCRHGDDGKHKFAFLACDSYLASVNKDSLTAWMLDRLERALQIAKLMNDSGRLGKALETVREIADTLLDAGKVSFWEQLVNLLIRYSKNDNSEYAEHICQQANEIERNGDFAFAVRLKEGALKLFAKNKQHERAREIRLELVELYVASAKKESSSGSGEDWRAYSRARSRIERSISHHTGRREDLEELYALLAEYSKKLEENLEWHDIFVRIESPLDDQDALNAIGKGIAESLAGKPFEEALLILAGCLRTLEAARIRKGAQQIIQDGGLASLFNSRVLNHAGKTVGRSEPLSVGWCAAIYRFYLANFMIRPAIEQINHDHDVKFENIVKALEQSDFVPAHSRKTFARGLLAGFEYDLAVVAHILPPMLENAFREILASMGKNTSRWDNEFISKERPLDWALKQSEMESVLGANLVFDLKTLLLTECDGMNLRNSVLHGLTTDSFFFPERQGAFSQQQAQVIYLWALALRLCLHQG